MSDSLAPWRPSWPTGPLFKVLEGSTLEDLQAEELEARRLLATAEIWRAWIGYTIRTRDKLAPSSALPATGRTDSESGREGASTPYEHRRGTDG